MPVSVPLSKLLKSWEIGPDGQFLAIQDNGKLQAVDDATIAAFHPLLPASLRVYYATVNAGKSKPESLAFVIATVTLDFLKTGGITVTSADGELHLLAKVFNLTELHEETIFMSCIGVNMHWVSIEGVDVPVLQNYGIRKLRVKPEDLDTQYPGWLDRWNMGIALGMDTPTILVGVFNKKQITPAPAEMPSVLFD